MTTEHRMQDTGKFRTNTNDQYYTASTVAVECVKKIQQAVDNSHSYLWIEPSAGNGVFLTAAGAVRKVGIDIDPKRDDIVRGNFLNWEPTASPSLVFGNPPFGRQGSTAKAFIQHSASFASVIAFILPRSFVKPSMSRAFPSLYHCVLSEELPANSFVVNEKEYDVPCVFQIWVKRTEPRQLEEKVEESGFSYVKSDKPFDIAFRRVGGLAGRCYPSARGPFSPQSHYFLKLDEEYQPYCAEIIAKMNTHVFPSNTVGPRSLSKGEANVVVNQILLTIANTQ
jgi:hypothetical protein